MPSHRREQLGEVIMNEISKLILSELKDPRIGFVSVTEVKVSSDYSNAHVYVSVMGAKAEQEATLTALRRATGFLRRELAHRIVTRHTPTITFHLDDSIERGARVLELLEQAKRQGAEAGFLNQETLASQEDENSSERRSPEL